MGLLCEVDVVDWGLPADRDYSGPLSNFVNNVIMSAQELCPVRTGFLRSTIGDGAYYTQTTAHIPVSAEYAEYVEYGTYKMDAQPYFEPAIEEWLDQLAEECEGEIAEDQEQEGEAQIDEAQEEFMNEDGMALQEDEIIEDLYTQLEGIEAEVANCETEEEYGILMTERDHIIAEIEQHTEARDEHLAGAEQQFALGDLIVGIIIALIEAIIDAIFGEAFEGGGNSFETLEGEVYDVFPNYDVYII